MKTKSASQSAFSNPRVNSSSTSRAQSQILVNRDSRGTLAKLVRASMLSIPLFAATPKVQASLKSSAKALLHCAAVFLGYTSTEREVALSKNRSDSDLRRLRSMRRRMFKTFRSQLFPAAWNIILFNELTGLNAKVSAAVFAKLQQDPRIGVADLTVESRSNVARQLRGALQKMLSKSDFTKLEPYLASPPNSVTLKPIGMDEYIKHLSPTLRDAQFRGMANSICKDPNKYPIVISSEMFRLDIPVKFAEDFTRVAEDTGNAFSGGGSGGGGSTPIGGIYTTVCKATDEYLMALLDQLWSIIAMEMATDQPSEYASEDYVQTYANQPSVGLINYNLETDIYHSLSDVAAGFVKVCGGAALAAVGFATVTAGLVTENPPLITAGGALYVGGVVLEITGLSEEVKGVMGGGSFMDP